MIDDIGTKIDLKKMPLMDYPPTMVVETSPGNFQVTYQLTIPVMDREDVEEVLRRIIAKLTGDGADPGMAGVTRVLRLPIGINGKPKYASEGHIWKTRLVVWRPDVTITWRDLCTGFGVQRVLRTPYINIEPSREVIDNRKRDFDITKNGLEQLGLIKRWKDTNWASIKCPWFKDHPESSDVASLATPSSLNGWFGTFICHAPQCRNRRWADLELTVQHEVYKNGFQTRDEISTPIIPVIAEPVEDIDEFLNTYEWQLIREVVFKRDGRKCAKCGLTETDGAILNIDHKLPRKYFPERMRDPTNCQVLCGPCNKAKGNKR